MPATTLPLLAFLLLFGASAFTLTSPSRARPGLLAALIAASLATAASAGLLGGQALLAIAMGLTLTLSSQFARTPALRGLALAGLAIWVLGAGFHAWPGFRPHVWMEDFGRHTQSLRWHYDKGFAGLLLLLALPRASANARTGKRWLLALPAGILLIMACSLSLGLATLEPRWQSGLALWLAGNLFLTVIAEEAFFRGLLQGRLQAWLATISGPWARHAYPAALAVSALLFGLVHYGWGWPSAAMAGLAGLFYGAMAGREMHLDRAIAAHFLTNASLILLTRSPLG